MIHGILQFLQQKTKFLQKYYLSQLIIVIALLGAVGVFSYASTNRTNLPITYQGSLSGADFIPVVDGAYYMRFAIYTSPTDTQSCIWATGSAAGASNCNSGTFASMTVDVTRGLFTVPLGSGSANNPEILASSVNFETNAYYLGVTICGTNNFCDSEMTPRRQLGGVPYAYNADLLDGLDSGSYALLAGKSGGQTLIGGTAANNALTVQGNSAASGNTATNANIVMKVGNSGGTTAMTILNNGSIGIGTTTPAASALVDMFSTTQGFRAPSMTTAQRDAIASPASGVMVFNSSSSTYQYYNGTVWTALDQPISGGTANKVAYFTSATTLSTNTNFHWDNSNGRLGIGISSPSSLLDITSSGISSSQDDTKALSLMNTSSAALDAQQFTPAIKFHGSAWHTGVSSATSSDWRIYGVPIQGNPVTGRLAFEFSNGGSAYQEVFSILSSGRFGLGTTTPATIFEIVTTTPQIRLTYSGSTYTELSTTANGYFYINPTGSRIGVGTSSPSSLLDITSSGISSSQDDTKALSLMNTSSAALDAQQFTPAIKFHGSAWHTGVSSATSSDWRIYGVPVQGNPVTGRLAFEFSNGGSAYQEVFSILSSGRFGLGTTTPATIFEIVTTTPQIRLSYNGSVYTELSTTANGYFYINPTGSRIGVGTSSPSSLFDITTSGIGTSQDDTKSLSLMNTSSAALDAQQFTPAIKFHGSAWHTGTSSATSSDWRIYGVPIQGNPVTGYLTFESSVGGGAYTSNNFVITSEGKVGVGTTTPAISGTGKLHVTGDTSRVLDTARTPLSNDTCNVGEVSVDTSYVYVCTASNTWKRAAITGY